MTKDRKLDLALEALEKISKTRYHIETPPVESLEEKMRSIADRAITAIKQARAIDKKAENARELGLDYDNVREDWGPGPHEVHSLPAQPAPVLWLVDGKVEASDLPEDYTGCLYTTPPAAQRQWQSLTDEEIAAADYITMEREDYEVYSVNQDSVMDFARAIEAKLKEKNT